MKKHREESYRFNNETENRKHQAAGEMKALAKQLQPESVNAKNG